MANAIEVNRLVKSYGTNKVLKDISFAVADGEIFALLGINGAGKTTTLECIEGVRAYDSGQIAINGQLGVQQQTTSLPGDIKAKEAYLLFAKWKKAVPDRAYLERLGVTPFMNRRYSHLSTGQKRRLHLAVALLGDPDIVILDEPTAGLDVEGRITIHSEIERLKEQGKTIILASHDMAEVEKLCGRIAILRDGKIVFTGTSAKLTENTERLFVLKVRFSKLPDLSGIKISPAAESPDGQCTFQTENIENLLSEIIRCIKAQNVTIQDIKVEQDDMESRFLEIAKEEQ